LEFKFFYYPGECFDNKSEFPPATPRPLFKQVGRPLKLQSNQPSIDHVETPRTFVNPEPQQISQVLTPPEPNFGEAAFVKHEAQHSKIASRIRDELLSEQSLLQRPTIPIKNELSQQTFIVNNQAQVKELHSENQQSNNPISNPDHQQQSINEAIIQRVPSTIKRYEPHQIKNPVTVHQPTVFKTSEILGNNPKMIVNQSVDGKEIPVMVVLVPFCPNQPQTQFPPISNIVPARASNYRLASSQSTAHIEKQPSPSHQNH